MIHLAEVCLGVLGLSWALSFSVATPSPTPKQGDGATWRQHPVAAVSVPRSVGPNTQQPVPSGTGSSARGGKRRSPIYFDAPPSLARQTLWR
jgi:hypothetical protein